MASVVAAPGLNAEAPEFHPNNNKLQKLQPSSSYFTFSHHRQLPYFYYYPTASKVHPFCSTTFSFHFHPPVNHHPSFPRFESEPKPTHFHEPNGFEKHELKNEMAVETFIESGSDSRQANEVISGGEMNQNHNHRRSLGLRSRGNFVWRRKDAHKEDDEQKVKKFDDDQRLMRKNCTHHHNARHFILDLHHKKKKKKKKKKNGGGFSGVPICEDGDETTVMIKNIPSKYSGDMLVVFLEKHCMLENAKDQANGKESTFAFDFVYLPIDFRTSLNKGYAFVNFTKHEAAWKFQVTASGKKWELFRSHKICHVVSARIQGREKLENRFGSTVFPCLSEEVLPLVFSPPRDGVTKGSQRTLGRLLYKRH